MMVSKAKNKSQKASIKLSSSAEKLQRSRKAQNPNKRDNRKYYYLAGILILTTILFSGITSNEFTNWDDDGYIINNTLIKDLSPTGIMDIFSSYVLSNYHPLTVLLFALELKVFGLDPSGFHSVSLVLHLINVVLVFFLFQLLGFRKKIIIPVCLLFAIHPMHVESIAWIAEQKDLLYALFFIASLISYLVWIKREKKPKWLILSIVFFALSLLSKSMAVTLPLILILFDWYLDRLRSKKEVLEKLPYFVLSILFGIIAIISQSEGNAMDITRNVSIIDRIFLTCYGVIFYLYKLVLPLNLSAIHYYPTKTGNFLPFYYYLMPIVILAIIYLIYKTKSNKKIILFGTLFFLGSISVVLQIIPVGDAIVGERYTYIPYLGLFLIVSFYYTKLREVKKTSIKRIRQWIYTLSLAYLCFLCISTFQRIKVWEDGISLFTDVIQKDPDNYSAYVVLANSYAAKNKYPEAIKNFDKAIDLNDQYIDTYMYRGRIKMLSGKLKEALEDYNYVIGKNPDNSKAYTNRGIIYTKLGDYKNALADLNKALSLDPQDIFCLNQRSQVYYNQNRIDDSFADLDKAISIDSSHSDAYSNRGFLYTQTGKYTEALSDLSKAALLDPNNSDIYVNLGYARLLMDDFLGAIKEFDKAIEANPYNFTAYSNRGIAKSRLNLKTEACNDWRKAANMGHQKSMEMLNRYCQ